MVIALVIAVVLGFLAAILGGLALLQFFRLRSTADSDRARITESLRRHRTALDTAFGRCDELAKHDSATEAGIRELCSTVDALGFEVASIGEEARLARRQVTRLAKAGAARALEAAPAAPRPCVRPADPDGEATMFFERPPANDGSPDRSPITPTKLSPAPVPFSASPSPPGEADEPEIPPALVGPRILAHLTAFAEVMGKTPVFVLRAAIVQGLTGGEPLFTMEDLATLRRVIAAEQAEGGPIPGTLGRGPDSGPRAG